MAGRLTQLVLQIIADSSGVTSGIKPAMNSLDQLGDKAEQTSKRVAKSLIPPDVQRRSQIASSLAAQREQETRRATQGSFDQVLARSRIATSLARQREREEIAQRNAQQAEVLNRSRIASSLARQRERESQATQSEAERRSRIAFSLAEQKRAELASRGPSFLRGVGDDVGGAARSGLGFAGSLGAGLVGGIVGAGFTSILDMITSTATKVLSTGIDVVRDAATKAITEGIARQDSEVAFGALLGSTRQGKELVDQISKLAIETPFGSKELLDESKLLLSYGVAASDLTTTLGRLGDVASGAGVDLNRLSLAFGQTLAKGRLQGSEIRQFTEAGIGIGDFRQAFRDVTGRNVSTTGFLKLAEAGEVSSRVVERAFERMTSAGGRFFNLMSDKSQTFGGRLQALRESVDVFAGKVGTSFIANTSLGSFLDSSAKRIQGIDTKQLDAFFRGVDSTVGPALSRAGRGFAGVLGLNESPKLDFDAFDKRLRILTDRSIPSLLDSVRDISAGFLSVAGAALRLANVLAANADSLAFSLGLKGDYEQELAMRRADAARGAKELTPRYEKILLDRIAADKEKEAARRAAIREGGGVDVLGIAETLERQAKAIRESTPGKDFREAARLPTDFLDNIIGPKANRALQDSVGIVGRVFNDPANVRAQAEATRLNRLNRAAFANGEIPQRFETVTGVDITKATDLFKQLGDGFKARLGPFGEAFDAISDKILPGFADRVEKLTERLKKPEDLPFTDFQRNIQATNILDSDFARAFGFGISAKEGTRLRGELGSELIARFKQPEIKPAPLIRQASQEAEQALTRAIYEGRNNGKEPAEELADALKESKRIQETNNDRLAKLAEALDRKQGGGGLLAGVGMPP